MPKWGTGGVTFRGLGPKPRLFITSFPGSHPLEIINFADGKLRSADGGPHTLFLALSCSPLRSGPSPGPGTGLAQLGPALGLMVASVVLSHTLTSWTCPILLCMLCCRDSRLFLSHLTAVLGSYPGQACSLWGTAGLSSGPLLGGPWGPWKLLLWSVQRWEEPRSPCCPWAKEKREVWHFPHTRICRCRSVAGLRI